MNRVTATLSVESSYFSCEESENMDAWTVAWESNVVMSCGVRRCSFFVGEVELPHSRLHLVAMSPVMDSRLRDDGELPEFSRNLETFGTKRDSGLLESSFL